jgi:endonuclease/exonuclease/phosphatase (EEP) superfamily protein YafD
LLWYVLYRSVGDDRPGFGYLMAPGYFVGLISIVAGAWLAIARKWALAAAALAIVLVVLWIDLPSIGRDSVPAQGERVRIVTASLRTMNSNLAAAAERLESYQADVIAVQEPNDAAVLASLIRRKSGPQWRMVTNGGVAIFSRLPLAQAPGPGKGILAARVRLPSGRDLTIWTLRAPKEYWQPFKLSEYHSNLVDQVRLGRPDIVAGDFNATPWNGGHRRMSEIMVDSFRAANPGPGFTFPSRARRMGTLGPLIRIDHIFVRPAIATTRSFVGVASPGADHHPVIADLVIPRSKSRFRSPR